MQTTIENNFVYNVAIGEKEPVAPSPGVPRVKFSARRRAVGLSPETVALSLNIDTRTLSQWQAGTIQPTPEQYSALCRLLSIHEAELQLVEASEDTQPYPKPKRRAKRLQTPKTAIPEEVAPVESTIDISRIDTLVAETRSYLEASRVQQERNAQTVKDLLADWPVSADLLDEICREFRFTEPTRFSIFMTFGDRLRAEKAKAEALTEIESANSAHEENEATD
jgi:hypothetical protein